MLRALTACLHSQEAQAHALKAAQQAQEADKGTCPDTLPAACPAHQHLHAAAAAAAAGNQKPAVTNVRERHDTANQLDLPCPLPEEGSCPFAHAASDIPLAPGQLNICPFGHGSVGSGPFPGYVHGRNPAICKFGCKPEAGLGKEGREGEGWKEALTREALEFQELYHREKGSSEEVKEARVAAVLAEIEATGTYTLTFDELQHGARVAWRNAPKCANRKFWEELRLIDRRDASTPEEMYDACLEVLETATMSCVATANIVCFRPCTPGKDDGPRVWNAQLTRFCCYKQADGSLMGDPVEKDFTALLQEEFGWKPPQQRSRFDILPLLLQAHPSEPPKLFEVPEQYVARVPIHHPDCLAFNELGLQWYAVPAVSALELSVGGLTFTAAPFNGWYSVTEVVRDLTDWNRYNMCEPVARAFGWDTRSEDTMWRDRAIAEVTTAVMHSFRQAGMGMVSHHTLMKNFQAWYKKEMLTRGYCPGNWKWIIPPISASASKCYLELNHMTEYTLKPGYWYAPGWKRYLQRLRDERAARESLASGCCGPEGHGPCTAGGAGGSCSGCPGLAEARLSMDQVLAARSSLDHGAGAGAGTATGTGTGTGSMLRPSASGTARHTSICGGVGSSGGPGAERRSSLSLSTVCAMKRMAAAAHRSAALRVAANKRPRLAVLYASVTGGTAKWAETVARTLKDGGVLVRLMNVEDFDAEAWASTLKVCKAALVMTSTYGPGAPPASAAKFLAWVQRGGEQGFGSTSYPRFCAAADLVHALLLEAGAKPLQAVAKADANRGEELAVWDCVTALKDSLAKASLMTDKQAEALSAVLPSMRAPNPNQASFVPRLLMVRLGRPEGLAPAKDRSHMHAKVAAVEQLLGPEAVAQGASTCLVKLDICSSTAATYAAGDEVAVWAENDVGAVEAFAEAMGLGRGAALDDLVLLQKTSKRYRQRRETGAGGADSGPLREESNEEEDEEEGEQEAVPFPQPSSLRTILTRYLSLTSPLTYQAALALASFARGDPTLARVTASHEAFQEWADDASPTFGAIPQLFPCLAGGALPFEAFVQLAPTIAARHYSVSSSSNLHPSQLHLTVSRLEYSLPSGVLRRGLCSNFLTTALQPGKAVGLRVMPTPAFRMPLHPQAPIIMVAAGTGIAPFRSFWQERNARKAGACKLGGLGPAVLIFGCRSSTTDHIYRADMEQALANGSLTHVITAYSREPGVPRQYVQDIVVGSQGSALLSPMLANPKAHVYVCGSAQMASEVADAFGKLLGSKAFDALVSGGRYHEDVFGVQMGSTVSGENKSSQALREQAMQHSTVHALAHAPLDRLMQALVKREQGCDLSWRDEEGMTLLHHAARAGDAQRTAVLLAFTTASTSNTGSSLSSTSYTPAATTATIASRGSSEGAALDAAMLQPACCTPAAAAPASASTPAQQPMPAHVLLEAVNSLGRTPRMEAHLRGVHGAGVAAVLDASNAPLVSPLHTAFYPLHAAVLRGELQTVDALLASGHAVDQVDFQGLTPLHLAVSTSTKLSCDALELLLRRGASAHVPNCRGQLPLQVAVTHGCDRAVAVLRAAGAPLAATHITSSTAAVGREGYDPLSCFKVKQAMGLGPEEVAALLSVWSHLSNDAHPSQSRASLEKAGQALMQRLLSLAPQLLPLLPCKDEAGLPANDELQALGHQAMALLGSLLGKLNNFDSFLRCLDEAVKGLVGQGVKLQHYGPAMQALTTYIKEATGQRFSPLQESAWAKLTAFITASASGIYTETSKVSSAAAQ